MIDPTTQVALSIGIPTLAVLIGILVNNSRMSDLRGHIDTRFTMLEKLMDARFDAAKAELLRVEGVMDARLKHQEEKG